MSRFVRATVLFWSITVLAGGCCLGDAVFPIGGVNVDSSKIGTGEPAFTPRDDENYLSGERTNSRRRL